MIKKLFYCQRLFWDRQWFVHPFGTFRLLILVPELKTNNFVVIFLACEQGDVLRWDGEVLPKHLKPNPAVFNRIWEIGERLGFVQPFGVSCDIEAFSFSHLHLELLLGGIYILFFSSLKDWLFESFIFHFPYLIIVDVRCKLLAEFNVLHKVELGLANQSNAYFIRNEQSVPLFESGVFYNRHLN